MKIAICSGGTGGHMFPAYALLLEMQKRNHEVILVTDERGNRFVPSISNKILLSPLNKWLTKRFPLKLFALWNMSRIFLKLLCLWIRKPPDVFVGFGGSITIIPAIVAKIKGSIIVLCEQNAIVGMANRFLLKIADVKLSGFYIDDKWQQVSIPVRPEFIRAFSYTLSDKIRILVVGGSQGARSFSYFVPLALGLLSDEKRKLIEVIHLGAENENLTKSRYEKAGIKVEVKRFDRGMAELMAKAHLIICRAGASTLGELSAIGRPAILIPYPIAADNHQLLNAQYYHDKYGAWVVIENNNTIKNLANIINNVIIDKKLLGQAAKKMFDPNLQMDEKQFFQIIETLSKRKV